MSLARIGLAVAIAAAVAAVAACIVFRALVPEALAHAGIETAWLASDYPLLLRGARTTIVLALVAGTLGFALAVLVAFGRVSRRPYIDLPLRAFTSVIRGTPLLVQLYALYWGVGMMLPRLLADYPWIRESPLWPILSDGVSYVALALVLSEAGYLGEIIRSALLAVPKGELEAARAFGMSPFLLARRVWLPRALGSILPTLAGEAVILLKSTALASTVTVLDLLGAANTVRARTFLTYEPLIAVALVYLVLTLAVEAAFRALERRTGRAFMRSGHGGMR